MPPSKDSSDDKHEPLLAKTGSNSKGHSGSSHGGEGSSHGGGGSSHGGHRPHHLKYGEHIVTSGFAPQLEEDSEEEIEQFRAIFGDGIDIEDHRHRMRKEKAFEVLEAEARRIHNNRRYLIRKPRAMQYFRGKTLVRSDEERASNRIELFFDLTFVGLIAVLAKEVAEEPTAHVLIRYLITYSMGFLIWTWMREMFNAFYKDDILQRFVVMFVIACLVIYGNNAPQVDQNLDEGPGRIGTVGSYLVAELTIFSLFLFYSFHIKAYQLQLRVHSLIWLVAACIWFSTLFMSTTVGTTMAVVALIIEYVGWLVVYSPMFKRMIQRVTQRHIWYFSAVNIEHEVERFQDFFTLVMGEFLFSVLSRSPAGLGLQTSGIRAVLAVMIAFAFQMFYMVGSSSKKITHPFRRSGSHAISFLMLHLPMVCALTLCGDIMAEFVKEEHVEGPLRWLACETYAVGMVCLWSISMIERDCDEPGVLWLPKWARLLPRLLAGLIAIPLPLTHQQDIQGGDGVGLLAGQAVTGVNMTSTKVLYVLTALSCFALVWEQIAALDGKNAPDESASEDLLAAAHDKLHPTREALRTPEWKGFPACIEPGALW